MLNIINNKLKLFFLFFFFLHCIQFFFSENISYNLFAEGLYLKGGLEIPNKYEIESEKKYFDITQNTENNLLVILNFSIGIDYSYEIYENFEIGSGLTYEGEARDQTNFETVGFNTIPFYFITKYNYYKSESFDLAFSAKIGYSFVRLTDELAIDLDDHSGGLYYGYSLSLDETSNSNNNMFYEFSYSLSSVEFENNDGITYTKENIYYSKYSLTIGKRFEFK